MFRITSIDSEVISINNGVIEVWVLRYQTEEEALEMAEAICEALNNKKINEDEN